MGLVQKDERTVIFMHLFLAWQARTVKSARTTSQAVTQNSKSWEQILGGKLDNLFTPRRFCDAGLTYSFPTKSQEEGHHLPIWDSYCLQRNFTIGRQIPWKSYLKQQPGKTPGHKRILPLCLTAEICSRIKTFLTVQTPLPLPRMEKLCCYNNSSWQLVRGGFPSLWIQALWINYLDYVTSLPQLQQTLSTAPGASAIQLLTKVLAYTTKTLSCEDE